MALNIDYCPRCGKIFAKGIRDICPACVKVVEQEYERCVQYLRENKGATIQELSEATEVSVKQIARFIREGRISLANTPNLMYPCEVCGTLIREGILCDKCRTRLRKDMRNAEQLEQIRKEIGQRERETPTYMTKAYLKQNQEQNRDNKPLL